MKRALIITTVSGFVPQFEMNNVRILQDLGYEVHYAANYHMPVYTDNNERLEGTGIIQHQIDFVRSPYNIGKNIKALKQLVSLMRSIKFHLVHCHTPMGGVLGRIAAHKTNTKPVIYTAHGFHFYKGAPVWNWLFFYPVERGLAHWTDCLITINEEDYKRAKQFKVKNSVRYIPGIGINIEKYKNISLDNEKKRQEIGVPNKAFLLISVGELTKRKNHFVIIKTLKRYRNPNTYYVICGTGKLYQKLENYIKRNNLQKNIILLGYRTDILELLNCSDCFIFPSLQEGLPVSVLEAMSQGLPIIASDIRGNKDLLTLYKGGYLVKRNNSKEYSKILDKISLKKYDREKILNLNRRFLVQFTMESITEAMRDIYINLFNK